MSVLDKLTEGIVNRDLQKEGAALLNKWEKTGLLEGLNNENTKSCMARLLENQAKELLREASTMAGGDVQGFASVAFPIVRRVFGSLIANDLVSVQPMSLPSGLIFFLGFTTSTNLGTGTSGLPRLGYGSTEESLYGGGRVGSAITGGVNLADGNAEAGPYGLNQGYSSVTASVVDVEMHLVAYGTYGGINSVYGPQGDQNPPSITQKQFDHALCQADPDFVSGTTNVAFIRVAHTDLADNSKYMADNLAAITVTKCGVTTGASGGANTISSTSGFDQVRRLSQFSGSGISNVGDRTSDHIILAFASYDGSVTAANLATNSSYIGLTQVAGGGATANVSGSVYFTDKSTIKIPLTDNIGNAAGSGQQDQMGAIVGAEEWGLENNGEIPEIDIKVDSVAVTAVTKKLKAKWTPELGQDLNAYHNLDAEVELTSILSEQIALEIDREILVDLVRGSKAETLYWSRRPGNFLDRRTARVIGDGYSNESLMGADFTGTVSEWYETLIETINDVSAQIHRKTLRGGANFVVTSPEVANILEFTAGFRANVTHDSDKGTVGAVNVGNLSKKWDVYVDPYFPRNLVLVGRKGGSFLESGYVYAPYVPLQVTPTIFGVEDFVPRKGVMTRYAKKMVRPDMYGLVVVTDMNG